MMRILMINYEFPPLGGGGGVASYQIAKALAAREHEVDVLTTAWRDLPGEETVDGLRVYRVPVVGRSDQATASLVSMVSFLPSGVARGLRTLRKKRYDILNTHFAIPSGPTGVALSRIFRTPQVLTIIGGDIYDPTKRLSPSNSVLLRAVVRRVLNSSAQIIAISQDIKNRAQRDLHCQTEIEVIHYGLTPPQFEKRNRQELGMPEDEVVLISIGRLIKRKALGDVLLALSRLEERRFRLLIIGEGPEEENLRDLAKRLGISSQVEFLGAIWGERKFQYLAAADMFVLPSIHEGFGLVFLEAMHCGLPVIASSSGGQTDFLEDGKTGFLIPVGDVQVLAGAILRLASDESLRRQMSEFNREYVKRFHISHVAERYEALFSAVLLRSRRTAHDAGAASSTLPDGGTYGS
ncbi:MAG TPA: glycosyltransferase family 4 protein [Anaerolineae bacterium]|nr:glycosyltransferase family 4 protein [Anaerolineae bacterium]